MEILLLAVIIFAVSMALVRLNKYIENRKQEKKEFLKNNTVKNFKEKINAFPLNTHWFSEYIYFIVPASIVYTVLSILTKLVLFASSIALQSLENPFLLYTDLIFFCISLYLYFNLRILNKHGFCMILIHLIISGIQITLYIMEGFLFFVKTPLLFFMFFIGIYTGYFFVWLLPNLIYFRKRKELFSPAPNAGIHNTGKYTVKEAYNRVSQFPLHTNWYWFYVYLRFPIRFLTSLYALWSVLSFYLEYSLIDMPAEQSFIVFLNIVLLVFGVIVFILMLQLHKSAYRLNFIYLAGEVVYMAYSSVITARMTAPEATPLMYGAAFLFSLLLSSLVWFLPNFFYFQKRKGLFFPALDTHAKIFKYNGIDCDRRSFVKQTAYIACVEKTIDEIKTEINSLQKASEVQSLQHQALLDAYTIAQQLKQNRQLTFSEAYNRLMHKKTHGLTAAQPVKKTPQESASHVNQGLIIFLVLGAIIGISMIIYGLATI